MTDDRERLEQAEQHSEFDTEVDSPETAIEPEGDDLALVRDLIVKAYPDVVLEMIGGETAAELLASVPTAQEAYRKVIETAGKTPLTSVPAGGSDRSTPLNIEAMSPELKIRMGVRGK